MEFEFIGDAIELPGFTSIAKVEPPATRRWLWGAGAYIKLAQRYECCGRARGIVELRTNEQAALF